MNSGFKIQGAKELEFFLKTFPKKVEKRLLKGALSAAALPIKREAKKLAPKRTGTLKKAIKSRRVKGRRAAVQVYVERGKRAKNDAWYAHIIEEGAKPHIIKGRKGRGLTIGGRTVQSVKHPGVKARPFMRPALETQARTAIGQFGKKLAMLIERELSK